jgi:hypothetical protein
MLAAVPDGDAREFLSQCGTALICQPGDVAAMMQILDRVYSAWMNQEAMGQCNQACVNQFERRNLTHALAAAFESLLSGPSQPPRPARVAGRDWESGLSCASFGSKSRQA